MGIGGGGVRERVLFSGRVQGVGFRATCVAVAGEIGVTGWVRNLDDGRVEAEVQGEAGRVDAFVAAAAERTWGRVDGVSRSEIEAVAGEDGFGVRR